MKQIRNPQLNSFGHLPVTIACFSIALPFLYFTGGANSPFFIETLGLLLLGGLDFQSRFKSTPVLILTLITYFACEGYSATHDLTRYVPHSVVFVHVLHLAMLLALLALVISFTRTLTRNQQAMERQEGRLNLLFENAHEMAQPIQVIMMSSSLLKTMTERNKLQPELVGQFAKNISDGAERASRALQQFSKDGWAIPPSQPGNYQGAAAPPKRG